MTQSKTWIKYIDLKSKNTGGEREPRCTEKS